MIKAIFISLVVLSSTACGIYRPNANSTQLTLRDVAWVSALINQPESDVNRQCLDDSLQVAFALLAFKDGRFDDKHIESALLKDLPNAEVRALRKADFAEWVRTHEPASVAANHLNLCLANNGNALPTSDNWLRCFLATSSAATLSIYRRSARPLTAAVQAVIPYYPMSAKASEITELAKQVYALPTDAADLQLREQIFVGCLARKQ